MLTVVPSRRAVAQHADRSLAAVAGRAARTAWTDRVVTLRELPGRILLAHPAPRPILSGAAVRLLVREIVDGLEPEVRRLFGPGIERPGAARAVEAAIAELRQAGLAALDVARAAGDRRRLRALAAALDAYERRLDQGEWWDDAAALRAAAGLVGEGRGADAARDGLEVRDLYDATPLQGQLLIALARAAGRARIHVPFDPHDPDATAYAYPYVHLWEGVTDPGLDVELVFAERDPAARVEVRPAVDPGDEARRLAGWIARRLEAGAAPESIGVVLGAGRRAAPVARELERRGIPCHARRGEPLVETPRFATALLPFRLLEGGFRRADLETWAATPLAAGLEPATLLPALARGPVVGGSAGAWMRPLGAVRGAPGRALVGALRAVESLGREEHPPAAFWTEYGRALDCAGVGRRGADDSWAEWEEAIRDLREALERLGRWVGPPLGWRSHRDQLLDTIGDRRAGLGRAGAGVELLTPRDARGLGFVHGAVIGLVQGALTARAPATSLLGDAERSALDRELGGPRRFRLEADAAREGALLLAERIRRTQERVFVSWPIEDADGTPLLPALELETLRPAGPIPAPVPSPAPAWRRGRDAARVAALQELERERAAFLGRDPEARRGLGGRYDGSFAPARAVALASSGRGARWTASRLETWRDCPHRFFQRYVLGLKPPEERSLEPEANAYGTLAHRALHRLHESGADLADPERVATEVAAAGADLDDHDRGDPVVWPIVLRRVTAALVRYFAALPEAAGGARPVAFELAFGLGDRGLDPIPIETAAGPVGLGGRMDRLDHDPLTDALHVVDYKYGKVRTSHREAVDPAICGVDRFQLYAYFLAALAWAEGEGHTPAGLTGAVHCIRAPRVLPALTAPDAAEIRARIAAVVEAAATGRFDPSPRDAAICAWCDYRRSCRIAAFGAAGAADDPDAREDER